MKAIVLKRRDFREFDQLITLFTDNCGKVELLAKGIKKITSKNSAVLQIGALVEIDIAKGKEVNHLTKVVSIDIHKEIRDDLSKSIALGYICELINKLFKVNEEDINIFLFLQKAIKYINQTDKLNKSFIYGFVIKLYTLLGFSPQLSGCVVCSKESNTFSIENGGIICMKCNRVVRSNNTFELTNEHIKYLRTLLQEHWNEINKLQQNKQIFKLIKQYTSYYSETRIKTI